MVTPLSRALEVPESPWPTADYRRATKSVVKYQTCLILTVGRLY